LRIASALVLAPMALGAVWAGDGWFTAFIVAVALGMAWEWARLCGRRGFAFPAGLAYVAYASAGLVWLRNDPESGLFNVVCLMLLVWASDIGAYAAGRFAGGPLLAPAISPGKTWSGAAGGLAAAVVTGLLASGGAARGGLIAGGLGLVAQAGDLAESALKRRFGVKDSGSLIPGHGGLLDRLDGLLAVTGAAVVIAALIGRETRFL
jgi:phosphatidate cytidylyltransferase